MLASRQQLLRVWGKTVPGGGDPQLFHPALFHMLDVANVARALLSSEASPRWKRTLARAFDAKAEDLTDWLPWVISLHDIGKISEAFQSQSEGQRLRMLAEGFEFGQYKWENRPTHGEISETFISEHLKTRLPEHLLRAARDMASGHHGFFSPPGLLRENKALLRNEPPYWEQARALAAELLSEILLREPPETWTEPTNVSVAVMALTGFTILCDWLGSDGAHFLPSADVALEDYVGLSQQRAHEAVTAAGFFQPSHGATAISFGILFPGLVPRPLQAAIDEIPAAILEKPCLAIIEAPTGEGKTEAALALAHRIASGSATDELYYALPTTATSNQMFTRLQEHINGNLALGARVKLVHSQAWLLEDNLGIQPLANGRDADAANALDWFASKKRSLLAPFGCGTIDQAELAALNVRHVALRMMGLTGKVVIVDEVHAYDVYMTAIIARLLHWLSEMGSSVILLSATLPKERRMQLIKAYAPNHSTDLVDEDAYPCIWVTNSSESYVAAPPAQQAERTIHLTPNELHFPDAQAEEKARWLVNAVEDGGCVCWITNTVKKAQAMFEAVDRLAPAAVDRNLLHSQFPLDQRTALEQAITRKYGPGTKDRPLQGIVVGTQVLEQSLDLDFDLMVSDLAPIDLLLQRAGRLQRHQRRRPPRHADPHFYINTVRTSAGLELGVDKYVYDEFMLWQTWNTVKDQDRLRLPADYRPLIEAVYGIAEPDAPELEQAWADLKVKETRAAERASLCMLPEPDPDDPFSTISGQQQFLESEAESGWIVAQTRLGEESITVIPLERDGNNARLIVGGESVSLDLNAEPSRATQIKLMHLSLRVSNRAAVLVLKNSVEARWPAAFRDAPLLKDCQPLWLKSGKSVLHSRDMEVQFELDPNLGLVIRSQKGG